MATIRVSNIEAKADVSSPTIDEKVKVTSSDGRVLVHIDGKSVGVTSIGINTTANTFTISNNNITFLGGVVASGISTLGNTVVGGGTTQLVVNGNARITGILTIGTSSVTIDGTTNTISGISSVTDDFGGYLTIPPGAVQFFARNTAPNGWIKANGANISRSTYSALFAGIGTVFGNGNGSTTFGIPDLRGEFPRGWDDGRGIDSGRAFGGAQAQTIESHQHGYHLQYRLGGNAGVNGDAICGSSYSQGPNNYNSISSQNTGNTGSTETRPRNIALLACIKY